MRFFECKRGQFRKCECTVCSQLFCHKATRTTLMTFLDSSGSGLVFAGNGLLVAMECLCWFGLVTAKGLFFVCQICGDAVAPESPCDNLQSCNPLFDAASLRNDKSARLWFWVKICQIQHPDLGSGFSEAVSNERPPSSLKPTSKRRFMFERRGRSILSIRC